MTDEQQQKQTIELIQVYRSLPALWDIKSTEYSDRFLKDMQYKVLLECYEKHNPGVQLQDLKKKINLLRTNYRRELRRRNYLEQKRKDGFKVTFETSLYYFDAISFLEEVINARPMVLASKREDELKKKKRKIEPIQQTYSVEGDPLEDSEDANHYLAKVWAEKLSTMDPTQKIFAEKVINDVFLNGQLGLLTFNTTLTQTTKEEPLNKYEFVQAFNYYIQNDDEFVKNLHEAYLNIVHHNNALNH